MTIHHYLTVAGYEGPDCSVRTGVPPTLESLENNGTCDTSRRPCKQIKVFAKGLLNGSVRCRITKMKVTHTFIQGHRAGFH